jgi:hypothetical protein
MISPICAMCDHCHHVIYESKKTGRVEVVEGPECRYNPPAIRTTTTEDRWPAVWLHEWCSRWLPTSDDRWSADISAVDALADRRWIVLEEDGDVGIMTSKQLSRAYRSGSAIAWMISEGRATGQEDA